ncbi:MAG: hypothetical protein AUJ57_01730 [Zetaproteobacteria bacterium CG1_02_53_45]|nr:MAG: hypothetical protein AUJ57_01730 [Zetaproteobacteria bacterium CG1_02_53_45]
MPPLAAPKAAAKANGLWKKKSFGFGDFIDMINPLQHLPVISTLYRKLTGDAMGDAARLVGGAIFGGLLGSWISGLASAVANVFASRATGKDVGEHMLSMAQPATASRSAAAPIAAKAAPLPPTQTFNIQPRISEQCQGVQRTAQFPQLQETAGSPHHLQRPSPATEASSQITPREQGQIETAMAQYRQQITIDEIRKETHYWV